MSDQQEDPDRDDGFDGERDCPQCGGGGCDNCDHTGRSEAFRKHKGEI